MQKKLTNKEKNKLWTIRHREKALLHSVIALVILAIPFFGYHWFFEAAIPEDTREENVEYRMSMVGDMMLGRHVHDSTIQSGESIDQVFKYVTPFFEESDYVTGNFESPILNVADEEVASAMDDAELYNKDIHLYSEPWAINALESAGFDSVTLANNHALDFGDLSLGETLRHFADSSVKTLGIGDAINITEEEAEAGAIDAADVSYFDINENTRVGIIGFTDVMVQGFSAKDYVGGVFTKEEITVLQDRLINAKLPEEEGGGGADIMIVHSHWGDEYQVSYNDRQVELAQYMTNYGADIIIGHHSHVLEPITVVESNLDAGHKAIVMNSMGNFVFDQGWSRTKESALAQLDFLDDGSKQLSFVPLRIEEAQPRETSGFLKPYRDLRVFRTLRKELEDEHWKTENGRLIIDLDAAGILEGVDITS
ncbi:CapA family protein [Salipaludibacillus sp. CF4.18]|uniref:CapA family protein n=1 Tax=Salipaludibacillus sp. CF4.18 TaxID=3373081 RepID=UPI003EE487F2